MIQIPRTMSTQHPDNVRSPFFSENHVVADDDEIKEAFYCYSHLKIKEQLWDFEGKDVDSSVVRKLLSKYDLFFKKKQLGKDIHLTYRVPNPDIEKKEGKILLETLESIPRSSDIARAFYENDIAPIHEVAVPMVTNATSLIRIAEYYKRYVIAKSQHALFQGDTPLSSWVGEFQPKEISIIPLFEDKESMLAADKIVGEYMEKENVADDQRVWLARSDPALNYGSAATVLIEKVALQRLSDLGEKMSVKLHPILGCGSAPFRGNFKPTNVHGNLRAYPSVRTFTLQSAFKYDYEETLVKESIEVMDDTPVKKPLPVDESVILPILDKLSKAYEEQVQQIAPLVNSFSPYVPKRRKRKLHIGLFGYSRNTQGISLPRAIPFCASLYSLGIPPDLFGLHVLDGKDVDAITQVYPSFHADLKDAVRLVNKDHFSLMPEKMQSQLRKAIELVPTDINEDHKVVSSLILEAFEEKRSNITELIEQAGWIRGFLG